MQSAAIRQLNVAHRLQLADELHLRKTAEGRLAGVQAAMSSMQEELDLESAEVSCAAAI